MALLSHDVQIGTGTAYAKELVKHEANFTQYGPPGRPYEYRAYPTMMYQAKRPAKGGDAEFTSAEAGSETQRSQLESIGFVYGGPAEALAKLEAREFEMAEAAAGRAFTDRKMTAGAQDEAAAVDEKTIQHLGSIPETPIRRGPGRPPIVR